MTRKRIVYTIRILLTVVILVFLFRAIGAQRVLEELAQAKGHWVLMMYAATVGALVANASLTRLLLRRVGLHVGLRRIMLANSLSTFYTLILPSDVAAGVAKWADLSAATGDKSRVLSVLLVAKIALALPPLTLGAAALALWNPFDSTRLPILAGALSFSLIGATALLVNRSTGTALDRIVLNCSSLAPQFAQKIVQSLLTAFGDIRRLRAPAYVAALSLSLAAFVFGLAGFACAAAAVQVVVPIATLMWVSMVLFITRLLPITLSNIGVREGVIVAAFGLHGVAPAEALLVGLIIFSNTLVIASLGACYQIAVANGWVLWQTKADSHELADKDEGP